MRYDDPLRPKICNLPAYLTPEGKAIAPLRGPEVEPDGMGGWELSWWLLTDWNGAVKFTAAVFTDGEFGCVNLHYNCEDFFSDPEHFFLKFFNYTGPTPTVKKLSAKPSLADLGL